MKRSSFSGVSTVHPHRCGEICFDYHACFAANGSPPQVWGNRGARSALASISRFTPTGVGKSNESVSLFSSLWVHPHRCGEISVSDLTATTSLGSPPQVWGNRWQSFAQYQCAWFTPTGVGKSGVQGIKFELQWVHPHRCGEINAGILLPDAIVGSPPQVWGNLMKPKQRIKQWRFTPTGVGKSSKPTPTSRHLLVHPHRCGEIRRSRAIAAGSPPQVWGNPKPVHTAPVEDSSTVHPHRCGEIPYVTNVRIRYPLPDTDRLIN